MSNTSRRKFLTQLAGAAALGVTATSCAMSKKTSAAATAKPFFETSLAEWSFHKAFCQKNNQP